MRRIGVIGMILGVLLIADGIYMVATQYNGGETQAWNLPDGWIIIISAAVLLVASILAFVLPARSRPSQQSVSVSAPSADIEPEKA